MFLLDTNVCIAMMRDPNKTLKLTQMLKEAGGADAVISSISRYELEMGVLGRVGEKQARQSLTSLLKGPVRVEALTDTAAREGARLNAHARLRGKELSSLDSLIAGHAIALGATLVTADAKLAEAVSEIEVVNWR
jgi:tRNA(fMet)-specific endonuclease VapC